VKRKEILLLVVFSPSVVFGAVSDDLNWLFQRFFGTETASPALSSGLETEFSKPVENPTDEDLKKIQTQIEEQENLLRISESEILKKQSDLWESATAQISLEEKLKLLDQELALRSQALTKLQSQKKIWQQILEKLTREMSEIKSVLRVRSQEAEKLRVENYIRTTQLDETQDFALLTWLFSSQSLGQILWESEQREQQERDVQKTLVHLSFLKQSLEGREKHAAMIFYRLSELEKRTQEEQFVFQDFARGKANLLSQAQSQETQSQRDIENAQFQKNVSERILQTLLSQKTQIETTLGKTIADVSEKMLAFPLRVPVEITASFEDPAYKTAFGHVHDGVDFFAPHGTDVFASADGEVVEAVENGFQYSYLVIKHANGVHTLYGHLSRLLVSVRQKVTKDMIIAKTGGTPGTPGAGYFTSGPHLHFGVIQNGQYKDPLLFLSFPFDDAVFQDNLENEILENPSSLDLESLIETEE